jgi:hypothetical protein
MTATETLAKIFSFAGCKMTVDVCFEKRAAVYYVAVTFCPGSDEMWDTMAHAARFATAAEAERLAARVRAARQVDLRFWSWRANVCSPFAVLQSNP